MKRTHAGRPFHERCSRLAARAAVCLLVSVGLVLGSLEIHHHAESFSALADGTLVFQAAAHPLRARHLESTGAGHLFHCPACLLHLHSLGDAAAAAVALGTPPAAGSSLGPGEPTWPAPTAHPGGSRAPPVC